MEDARDQIRSIVERAVDRGVVPGASVVVVEGDRRFDLAHGVADPAGNALTLKTVGRYYSSVKAVTSAVVLALVEDGLLTLDAPISELLPEWSERRQTSGIPTVRQLLTHTSGLTYPASGSDPHAHPVDAAYHDAGIDAHGNDTLKVFSQKLSLQPMCFEPGQRWRYSLSHDLLGRIIEHVTEMPAPDVFSRRIFQPLEMVDSGLDADAALLGRLGACWEHNPGEVPELELVDPAGGKSSHGDPDRMVSCGGGFFSTIDDYVRFLLMLRNGGVHQGQRVLSKASVDEMMTDQLGPHVQSDLPDSGFNVGDTTGFGFGGAVSRDGSGWFGWGGYAGTSFVVDRKANRVAALHIQVQNDFSIPLWNDLSPILTRPERLLD